MFQKAKSFLDALTARWPFVPFLGFGFYLAWIWLSFSSTVVTNDYAEGSQALMVLLSYLVSTVVIGLCMLLWGVARGFTERLVASPVAVIVFGLITSASTLIAGCAPVLFPGAERLALSACAGIAGIGTSVLLMRFGSLCAHVGLRDSLANASGASLVAVSLYFIVIALPGSVALVNMALLPLGAGLVLVFPEYDPFPASELSRGAKTVERGAARREFNRLLAATAVVSFFGGLGRGLSVLEFDVQLFGFSGIVTALLVGTISIAILAVVGGARGRNPAGKLYLGIMVLTVFILFLACFDVGITYINGCKEALWILFSCLFAYSAFRFDFRPVRTFAFGQTVYLIASAVGWGAGALLALQHFSYGLRVATSVLIMLAFVVVIVFVFRPSDIEAMTDDALLTDAEGAGEGDAGKRGEGVRPAPAFFIDPKYGLSERESEIVLLYVQGRSANWIADELVISVNTVHTHLRNAYTKLGVHDRQQLRDLLESA